ncbi:hypothetical protein RhiirA5_416713 [Rhizophagus irregularis]|uniref:Uncharacterized protein n=1 Tax=Rhizophagus irregularis TaxID=588596 RepID=A0A2N0QQ82_9GLOM|nr:hypothetical protein RhiirA5_416713 [Rhizophagus irregularis]PKC53217.1 hypothetical protein RhiirA1_479753 [Rhizophagus irregularis]
MGGFSDQPICNLLDFSTNFNRDIILHQRMINKRIQRIQRQRRRTIRRIYRRCNAPFNPILNQIAQLPLQTTNEPFAVQLFNGSSFY